MTHLDVAYVYPAFLVFTRAAGLFFFLPVFSGGTIPQAVRLAVALVLAYALAPVVLPDFGMPTHWVSMALEIAHELFVGSLMGLVARFIFYALEFAGEIIAQGMGLSIAGIIDPITRDRITPTSSLLLSFGSVLFVVTNAHHWCLLAFARSFEILPPNVPLAARPLEMLAVSSGQIFLIGVQIAAPMLAISFLVNLCFAALGRAAPAVNVFLLSFPVQILAGLALFSLTFALTAQHVLNALRRMPEQMLQFLR